MSDAFDVVIVGAGPTGLTLAHLLAQADVKVLLVEQNASTVGEPRAVSIDDESMRTLQSVGLADAAMADIAPAYGSEYLGPDGRRFAVVSPSQGEFGWPKRSAFRQPLLEGLLAEALKRNSNATLRFNTQCAEHRDLGDRVIVTLERSGERSEVTCRFLIGADGGRSRTRRAIGAQMTGSSFEEKWLIADLVNTIDPYRETRVFSDPRRPALTLPGPNRTRRYEIRLKPGESEPEMVAEPRARALIAQYGGDANAQIDRLRVYTFQARIADCWRRGNVFLAGDAAHLMPPFAGQGMNTGLRDAANLAWKLAAVLKGKLGPALLDSYETERRDHAWTMIQFAVRMGYLISPENAFVAALTRFVFRASRLIPPLRDWLVQMRFKPKPRFKKGFFAHSGRLSAQLCGRMVPQPMIERGQITMRLDDVLGPGFSILCFGQDPAALAQGISSIAEKLGANVVGCLPRNYAFPAGSFEPLIRDSGGEIGRFLRGSEAAVMLVRPDRYVAATFSGLDISDAARVVSRLIETTFATPGA